MKLKAIISVGFMLTHLGISACQALPEVIPQQELPTQTPLKIETTTVPITAATEPASKEEQVEFGWWNDVVFYEIFVRSFKDSDGDGVGDFQGLISQLDYLNDGDPETTDDLGVGGIWLMPINPSPSYHGYDVTNYMAVNPDYGSLNDFKQLLEECHKRGIHVIMDFVINHTSSQHPWFLSAQDPQSGFRDWYIWADQRPSQIGPWGQNTWYHVDGRYYYALFWSEMPDLNYHQPMVTKAIYNATKFWLDLGVDGFRVDAARYLLEEGVTQQDSKGTIAWFQDWRDYYTSINPETYTVGEVWTDTQIIAKYNQPTRGMQNYFMFDLAADTLGSVYSPDPSRLIKSYLETLEYFPDMQFATFLTNHDQQRVASYFNERLMDQKLAAFIYLTGPGVPYIYYGEEIGMTGGKPDENIRTPMQWSTAANAGFSESEAWQPINEDWATKNVALQDAEPDSLLNWYRDLVHLRNQNAALRTGNFLPFTTSCRRLYVTARVQGEDVMMAIANLGVQTLENCTISLEQSSLSGTYQAEAVWGEETFNEISFSENGSITDFELAPILEGGETIVLVLKR